MTNREAAEIMKAIIFILKNDDYSDEVEEAIHMAINALKAQEKAQEVSNDSPELDKENGELISRQAAIDAMESVDWYHINKDGQLTHGANSKEDEPLYKAEDVYKVLNTMPSAQPELIEKVAYIRGFEQGRTQGMIDAQGHGRSMPDERIKYI